LEEAEICPLRGDYDLGLAVPHLTSKTASRTKI